MWTQYSVLLTEDSTYRGSNVKVLHMCEVRGVEEAEGGVILQRQPHPISHGNHLVHLCTLVGMDLERCLQQGRCSTSDQYRQRLTEERLHFTVSVMP